MAVKNYVRLFIPVRIAMLFIYILLLNREVRKLVKTVITILCINEIYTASSIV